MSEKLVCVFGGSGFLGSHVADTLTEAGYKVRIFDSQPSPFIQKNSQEMVIGDIMDFEAVRKASEGCNIIYNFAGLSDIDQANDRPLDTVHLNVLGNINILEAARQVNATRFIFASSIYVLSEKGSFYRASKQSAERFVEAYHERYGLEYTILRYGSLYGRRADERNGIYRMVKQALENRCIIYNGDPDSSREYIHAKDAAQLSVQILNPTYANRHIILTGHERFKVKDLMKLIAEMIPGGAEIHFGEKMMKSHYVMTPYAFNPKIGHKLLADDYIDLGQGILDCLTEIYENNYKNEQVKDNKLVSFAQLVYEE